MTTATRDKTEVKLHFTKLFLLMPLFQTKCISKHSLLVEQPMKIKIPTVMLRT
jgi:hypothetical protein